MVPARGAHLGAWLIGACLAAHGGAVIERVPNTAAGKLVDVLVIGDSKDALASMAVHKLMHGGKAATGTPVSLWGNAKAEFIMSTPKPGPWVLSLFLTSGETRRGRLSVRIAGRDHRSPEISAKGKWTPVLYSYRFSVPRGQMATKFTITGNGLYINRAFMSSPAKGDGSIRKVAPSSCRTVLRGPGKRAKAVVLSPRSGPEGAHARALAARLGLPVRDEPEFKAPLPAYPLSGVDADTSIILVCAGRGGPLTQALRRATLILENERVPGAGGYAIRTVARPFAGSAANVIVIATSEPGSLAKACRAFAPKRDGAEVVWDRFLVEQAGSQWAKVRPYYYRLKKSDAYFSKERRKLSLPAGGRKGSSPERGYIHMTAECGDRYYRTGNDAFALLYRDFIFKMEKDGIYGGHDSHMELYGLMRGWDRVEESPALSEADRLRITNFLLGCIDGPEGFWRSWGGYQAYSGPVKMRHNHQTILADGLMQAYLYYSRLYELGGAGMWKQWLDDVIADATRWGRAPEDSENYEPLTFKEHARLLRYQGLTTKGQSGTEEWLAAGRRFLCARDSLGLPATYGDCWDCAAFTALDWLEVLDEDWGWRPARWTIDRVHLGYKTASPAHGVARADFAYLHCSSAAEGPKTVPPARPSSTELKELTGLVVLPVARGYYGYMRGLVGQESFWRGKRKPWAPPHAKAFDKIAYRSGWRPGDEYLFVEGIGWADHGHHDLGALVHYCSRGRVWIVDGGYENTGFEHHSTVEVKRDGKSAWGYFEGQKGRWGDFRSGPPMAELVRRKPLRPGTAGPFEFTIRTLDVAGAAWTRKVKGGGGRALEVTDTLVAAEPGSYEIVWRLRLLGEVNGKDDRWLVSQKGAILPVRLTLGKDETCAPRKWEPDSHTWNGGAFPWYPFVGKPGRPVTLEWKRAVRLARGQKTEMKAVIGPAAAR